MSIKTASQELYFYYKKTMSTYRRHCMMLMVLGVVDEMPQCEMAMICKGIKNISD